MAKGFFTQGAALLTNGQTTIADIKSAPRQHAFDIVKESPAHKNWQFTLSCWFSPSARCERLCCRRCCESSLAGRDG